MDDPFSYSARWDSAGLDCSYCKYESDVSWPNLSRDYKCNRHKISLAKVLDINGYKKGEWFCSAFAGNKEASPKAVKELEAVRVKLNPGVLYGAYGSNRQLKEIPFVELKSD